MEITTQHGAIEEKSQRHDVDFYSLDAIISVGYRVSSPKATKFRQWSTKILNEYIKKGFVLDDDRLKQGTVNCLRGFALSVPAKGVSGNRLQIYTPSAVRTMTSTHRPHTISMQ